MEVVIYSFSRKQNVILSSKPGLISPSVKALKGEKGKDCEVHVPLGISVLDDDGKQIGKNICFALRYQMFITLLLITSSGFLILQCFTVTCFLKYVCVFLCLANELTHTL